MLTNVRDATAAARTGNSIHATLVRTKNANNARNLFILILKNQKKSSFVKFALFMKTINLILMTIQSL